MTSPSDIGPPRPPLWVRALTVAALLVFGLGLLLTLLRADVVALAVGQFGATRARAALIVLLLAAAFAGSALGRSTGRRRRLLQLVAYGSVILATVGVWLDRTPYDVSPVSYRSSDTELAGTLYLPATPGHHPAVVIVHGTAPLKRMFYGLWADRIARNGFVVLLTDKRGVGGSGGVFERNADTTTNITRLADDVVAGVDYLATRAEVDTAHIGLVGVDQAGWVAPRAAEHSARIRFLALITGAPVSAGEVAAWSRLRGRAGAGAEVPRPRAEVILDTLAPSGVDSRGALAHLSIPTLWLFGGVDDRLPTVKSVRALVAVAQTGRPATWRTFPEYGHLLIGRHGALLPRVAPESWPVLLNWLFRQGGQTPP